MIRERINRLRRCMAQRGIDAYLIPTSDFHESEYVGEYFKGRKWVSGFSGSAGTLVAGLDEAYLFTDGRYYVQAEKELAGSGIDLKKSGMPGVPSPEEFLAKEAKEGTTVAFDKRVVAGNKGKDLIHKLEKKGAIVKDAVLLDTIWTDRPKRSANPIVLLEEKICRRAFGREVNESQRRDDKKGSESSCAHFNYRYCLAL